MTLHPDEARRSETISDHEAPHIFYLRQRREEFAVSDGFIRDGKCECSPILLGRNLPLDERMVGQLAVPLPPQLQAILIQGGCFVRPSHAAE